ncbi:fimbrial protein [Citrobacter portucalensis]|uniref:Fimbrial protein n=1 Tax=Citrobacter portucalensis TaxID=1639133 RepID=A0A9X4GN29_9ENTR|nr:fimbrial protein [Citrobacter portucalensis]MDE9620255.1 fimbrial protein [Citrobacter portucalensis]
MRALLLPLFIAGHLFIAQTARADYFSNNRSHTMSYDFSSWTVGIPPVTGESSGWWEDAGNVAIDIVPSDTTGSYITLQVNGTLVGNNTYATSNPGVGIKYQTSLAYITDIGGGAETAPDFRFDLGANQVSVNTTSYLHIKYQLVRLQDKVLAGPITSAPQVTVIYQNPDGVGKSVMTTLVYSGAVSVQPNYSACQIDAPTEIKLTDLYGANIANGALNTIQAPTITLLNCPGAINGISYNFSAVYGVHDATNGVLDTVSGAGYAKNVYIQVQNADGTPHTLNTDIPLSNYTGSGDYTLPDFKVGYFIDDASSVTAGNVKTAIELKVTYN